MIGLALQIYSNEHGGRYPPSFDELLTDGSITSEVFICFKTSDQRAAGLTTQALLQDFRTPGRNSYVYAASGAADQSNSSAFVLAYEPLNHHGFMHVVYGDSQVGRLREPEASRVIAELNAGFNPPRPPTSKPRGR
jgi:hypothetical protein